MSRLYRLLPWPHDPENQLASILAAEKSPTKRIRFNFDTRILLMTLLISLPGVFVAELLLWLGNFSLETKWTVTLFIHWPGSSAVQYCTARSSPLQTLSNMVAAIVKRISLFACAGPDGKIRWRILILESMLWPCVAAPESKRLGSTRPAEKSDDGN